MSDAAIRMDDVSKRFWLAQERRTSLKERFVRGRGQSGKEFFALKDATFEVPRGTTFGLVGHNGSGKSTALKVIAGIYRPTSGDVVVDGRLSALLELGAGFHGELTGRENVRLNGSILGMSRRQIDDAMDEIVDFSGIGDFIDTPVKVYSSGMFVRLGFAIAIAVRPEILVIDEVIAVGDEEFQRKCFDHLHRLRATGTTIVLVSHALSLIEDMCDTAVWLDHGRVQDLGEARSVVRKYLGHVNDAESMAATSSATTVGAGQSRVGSGEIRIESAALLDVDGKEIPFARPGHPLRIRLRYRASQGVDSAVFGVAFLTDSGVTVSAPTSARGGPWSVRQGEGAVEFTVDALALQPGTFSVTTTVADRGHIYDQREQQLTIKVRGGGDEARGLVRMPGEWSISESAESA